MGGSAAGLFTAWLVGRSGRSVQVFERAEDLDPAPRTLIVTAHMREVLGGLAEDSIINEIRQFEVFTDGRSATIPLKRPDLVIERARLIRSLADNAQRAGAELHLGRRFVAFGDGRTLLLERCRDGAQEEVEAPFVVGADGAASGVARAAGWPRQPTVPLIQALVNLPKDLQAGTVRVWFVPEETPYFYWLIPESSTTGAVGLIAEEGQRALRSLHGFLEKRGMTPLTFQGARIPLYTGWRPIHRAVGERDVYLVGDAAGQVKVSTVGGIVTGFRGALAVARAILHGKVASEVRALRRELDLHLWIRRALHRFTQNDYSRLLDLLNPASRESLGQHTRDQAAQVLWRLCLSEPRLLWLGLRGLLTGSFPGSESGQERSC